MIFEEKKTNVYGGEGRNVGHKRTWGTGCRINVKKTDGICG